MPAQVALTEAEARAFSSLLRRASDRLETYEEQTHQDRRLAEEIRIAADELVSRLRPDQEATAWRKAIGGRAEGRLGIFAAQRPITPIDHGGMRPDTSAGSQGRAFVQTSGRSGIHLQGQLLSWSGRWVALVVGEVAVQLLAGRSLGDGVDQELTLGKRRSAQRWALDTW
jgi:hypothetical protein